MMELHDVKTKQAQICAEGCEEEYITNYSYLWNIGQT